MITYPLGVGHVTTRVLDAGRADDPVIVLIHGLSSRADRWTRNIDALAADGFRVVACDLPGHGFATKDPAQDHTIGAYADFVLGVLDALHIERTTLVGASLGGHVAAMAALRQPHRVERLMMIASTGLAPSPPERARSMRDWLLQLTPDLHRQRLRHAFSEGTVVSEDMVQEDVRINTSPGAAACFDRFLAYMADGINNDLVLERLATIEDTVPLLLLWGSQDPLVPVEVGRSAHARLTKSRLICVDGLRHSPYYENAALFNDILVEYVRDTSKVR